MQPCCEDSGQDVQMTSTVGEQIRSGGIPSGSGAQGEAEENIGGG